MEEKVKRICPDALVCRRGSTYIVLLPGDFEDKSKIERLFTEAGKDVEFGVRQGVEVWSRVMGYLRPYRDQRGNILWNAGKVSEYKDRKMFTMQGDRILV